MKTKFTSAAMVTLLFLAAAASAWSQSSTARIKGTITAGGKPLPDVQVVLTSKDNGRKFKYKTDKNGQLNGYGVPYGDYDQEVFSATGESLHKKAIRIVSENGSTENDISLDVSSGGAGQPTVSKEELEKLKGEREKALGENALIAQLNPALQAKDWATAEPILQKLITMNPARWDYQQALGNAQLSLNKYDDAVATFEKAIPLAENASKNDPKSDPAKAKVAVGQMLTSEGNAYLKLKKNDKAIESYTKAAAMDPNPGTAYFNLCATQYNSGNTQGALAACDKAIAADPNRADAYYIKGSLMMGDSKQDKDGKLIAPPGTAEALNKYLELAPDGGHANDVKQMLAFIGAKIETTYKKKK
ncbi:MAG TPA: tetratricopeptide repeat protein [Candidatus Angelobacter sp.]|jgi:tetratricopeptide (TPR) repeat protein|nr:tetratricopeptide repeat protein [Candidatus Angelobacter sp.]